MFVGLTDSGDHLIDLDAFFFGFIDDDVKGKRRVTSDAQGKGKAVAVDGHEEASASTDPRLVIRFA